MKTLELNQMEIINGGGRTQEGVAGAMIGAGTALCLTPGLLPLGIVCVLSGVFCSFLTK